MITKGRDRTYWRWLCKATVVGMLVTLIVPFVPEIQKSKAADNWWNTDYLKRARITVNATTNNLPQGSPVQIYFDSRYMISAANPTIQKMRADGKDLRIVYDSGSGPVEIDRDIVNTSKPAIPGDPNPTWGDTDSTVFFATQAEIGASSTSNDYWIYYDHDDETTAPLSSKANIYGSHTKAYVPLSDHRIDNRIADTISSGYDSINNVYVEQGVNGNGDMAIKNILYNQPTVITSSTTDLGTTAGTVELWVKNIMPGIKDSAFWSVQGCIGDARGCVSRYQDEKLKWIVQLNDGSQAEVVQTTADAVNPYTGAWRHIAFTWENNGGNGNAKIYRDGVLVGESSYVGNYINFPAGKEIRLTSDMSNTGYSGGWDEWTSSDYAKTALELNYHRYSANIEANFYGDRKMMEIARSTTEVANKTVTSYDFAEAGGDYFYSISRDWAQTTESSYLLKQRKSDLSVVYSYDIGAFLIAKGAPYTHVISLEADYASSPARIMVNVWGQYNCPVTDPDQDEMIQFEDNGSAFSIVHEYVHDDNSVDPAMRKLQTPYGGAYHDGYFYVAFWHGDRTCNGATLIGGSKRPGVAKINPVTYSVEYLQLYSSDPVTALLSDDGLTYMDFDDDGYMYVMRYNRLVGSAPTYYKVDLNTFTLTGSYGAQERGVKLNKVAGEDAVWVDGRIADASLRKYKASDGSYIAQIAPPTSPTGVFGSSHVQLPVSKGIAADTGSYDDSAAAGLAWFADTTTGLADPNMYEIGGRLCGTYDGMLYDSAGYLHFPTRWENQSILFSPGISPSYSMVTPSATSVPADGTTPLTVSVALKSTENLATLPENLSVKVVPSSTDGLTLTSNTGYAMEQGFSAGATDETGTATFSYTSSKTQKTNFTVYAEGMEIDNFEVNFVQTDGTHYRNWDFSIPGDYTYDTSKIALSNTAAQLNVNNGDGSDGDVAISANKNINTDNIATGRTCADAVNYSVSTLTSTSATLSTTPADGCLATGDEVMIANLQGTSANNTNVGNWEYLNVSSVSTDTVNFSAAKTKYYGNGASDDTNIGTGSTNQRVMLQRVPNYHNVTIDSGKTLTASAWDGTKSGVLMFRANGTVTNSGTIDMSQKGFRGGTSGSTPPEDYQGTIATATGDNGDNGGDSVYGLGGGAGGGAGGNSGHKAGYDGTSGKGGGGSACNSNANSVGGAGGEGGGAACSNNNAALPTALASGGGKAYSSGTNSSTSALTKLSLGGGSSQGAGGGGAHKYDCTGSATGGGANGAAGTTCTSANLSAAIAGGSGNPGGGVIAIAAGTLANSGTISSSGGVGGSAGRGGGIAAGGNGTASGQGGGGSGGNGASGGSILLFGNTITLGASAITATGGNGGAGGYGGNCGAGSSGCPAPGAGGNGGTYSAGGELGTGGTGGVAQNWGGGGGGGGGGAAGAAGKIAVDAGTVSGTTSPTYGATDFHILPSGTETSTVPDSGQAYSVLVNFYETTESFQSSGDVKYQISSDDGTSWYWWNGASWTATVGGYTEANTDDEINAHISSFGTDSATKVFKWRMWFTIDGTSFPEIDTVTLGYEEPIPTPTPIPISAPSSNVTATATAVPSSSSESSSSSSSLDQSAIKYNVMTNYKTSDYAFVLGINSLSQDGTTREDTNLTTDKTYDIYDQLPIFRGTTYPNSDITIEITDSAGEKITWRTTSDNDGYWQYQPTEKLTSGEYTIIVTVENKDKGVNFTSGQYKIKIAENIKASTPALSTNKEVTGIKAGITFWIYLILLIILIALIIFLVLKRRGRK